MNNNIALILFKIALTLPVTYALAYPLLNPSAAGGILKEVEMLGVLDGVVLVATFLKIVFLYCRDLYRSLSLVSPSARMAPPRSVWLMFLIPYNFVEDFFIVANLASSLRREAQHNSALHSFKSFGMSSGLGWCTAQIVSLLPNEIGLLAGVLALPPWIIHWRFIRRVNAVLTEQRLLAQTNHQFQPTAFGHGSREVGESQVPPGSARDTRRRIPVRLQRAERPSQRRVDQPRRWHGIRQVAGSL